ncbi:hypothetical protein FFF34_009170 [Inquilinus sp. KBS0705]|nr:hypothetical protein FFF34_009170 [Inquilinus sp. KBS0705]
MKCLVAIAVLFYFASCKPKTQSDKGLTVITSQRTTLNDTSSLRKMLEKTLRQPNDFYEILFNHDTLKLISGVDYLYYPFGKHADVNAIIKQVTNSTLKNIRLSSAGGDTTGLTEIETSKSRMKLFYDIEQNRQQIVSADINDNNFHLKNKIEIGISKEYFFNVFFNKPPLIPTNIIKLISVVDGIKHYYYFKNNRLVKITMITDYTFENK